MADTRQRLIDGAVETIRRHGLVGTSARTIAATAGVNQALDRLLAGSPLTELVDTAGLARAVCAGFVGLELFDGVDPAGATLALDTLDRMAVLLKVVEDLGPVARRAVLAKIRKSRKQDR